MVAAVLAVEGVVVAFAGGVAAAVLAFGGVEAEGLGASAAQLAEAAWVVGGAG